MASYPPLETTPGITNSNSLQYLVRETKEVTGKRKAIVLLHGVGSNEQDLFRVGNQLPGDFLVIVPRGKYTLGAGRYAWYQVDFSTGRPVINAGQEASSRETIFSFIKEVKQQYHIDELYLGGFSQGAIMSYTIGLLHPDEVDGIIALSGRILDEIKDTAQKNRFQKWPKVFVAHGLQDRTLPIHFARQAKDYLENVNIPLSYHEYDMGHMISGEVITDLINWLR